MWLPSTDVSQLPEEQSEFTAQGSPSGHETQFPPQSIAVSAPFCSPSVQVASMGQGLGQGTAATRVSARIQNRVMIRVRVNEVRAFDENEI